MKSFLVLAALVAAVASSAAAPDDLIAIPAGRFVMGSVADETASKNVYHLAASGERPAHEVVVAPFRLAAYDVTRAQFAAFAEATGYVAEGCNIWDGFKWKFIASASWHNPGFAQTGKDPVVCVSTEDADAYIAWYSGTTGTAYRLPSEAEWEYAARAGTTTSRYWGNEIASQCLYANGASREYGKMFPQEPDVDRMCSDEFVHTSPVGSFRANPWGLYDMIGDVWQWTADCAHKDYNGAPSDGSAWIAGTCKYRRYRGGSWYDGPWLLRSASRNGGLPNGRYNGVGFRLAAAAAGAAASPTEELLQTDRTLAVQSLEHGFVTVYARAMGTGARKLDPGGQPVIGRQAILALMATYPTKGDTFTWTPEEAVVASSGDLGFTWGRWTDIFRHRDGKITRTYGKYLDVWHRDSDGKWRWIADMGNSNPAPSPGH